MSMTRIDCRILLSGCLALALHTGESLGGFSYEWDFSDGLTGWTVTGNVKAVAETALLSDAGAAHSTLHQAAEWDAPTFTIELEFQDLLSNTIEPGRFPDAFFASAYFVDDLGSFDLATLSYDHALPLFTITTGQDLLVHTGTVGPGESGENWQRYQATLSCDYAYVIPVFELLDYNLTTGDSGVQIDHVLIIPEPRVVALLGLGTVILLRVTRRRRVGSI